MVRFSTEEVRSVMNDCSKIRNICIIAHVDHGKSTLSDALIARAGLISRHQAGDKTFTDDREDEKERGITIKSSTVTMCFEATGYHEKQPPANGGEEETKEMSRYGLGRIVVNLIDSPGHVDFSAEVTASLRLTDGAIVVVDAIEGVRVQTQTVLRQALAERVRPVLMINKMDRLFVETNSDLEAIYQCLCRGIESINVEISTFQDDYMKEKLDWQLNPRDGTVCFGSGLHGWGFTIPQFAEMLAAKSKVATQKWMKRLWGDFFYDPSTSKWSTKKSKTNVRGFCHFILKPIRSILDAALSKDFDGVFKKFKQIGITIASDVEKEFSSSSTSSSSSKDRIRLVMQNWLPVSQTLLTMIIDQLPSPQEAQQYRMDKLYTGPKDDSVMKAMRECDPMGPLMVYVSKMLPNSDGSRFVAVGRVFSGTVSSSSKTKLRILGPDFNVDSRDVAEGCIQRVVMLIASQTYSIYDAPSGSIVGLVGIDKLLKRSGTITSDVNAWPIKTMQFSVAPVVQVAVKAKKSMSKVMEVLRKLEKVDPMLQIYPKNGECVVAGAGELHLDICLNELKKYFSDDEGSITISQPIVSFCETVKSQSAMQMLVKTQNKLNHLMGSAQPVDDSFVDAIENNEVKMSNLREMRERVAKCSKARSSETKDDDGLLDYRNVWAISNSANAAGNLLVDTSKGVQNLNRVKESIIHQFVELEGGALCGEPLRGVRFDIEDAKIHAESAHHGIAQIGAATKRLFWAAQLSAEPQLLEPIYEVHITVSEKKISGVYTTLSQRKAKIISMESIENTPMMTVVAELPVRESFGLDASLKQSTAGEAFSQLTFSHWGEVDGNPLEDGTQANRIVREIRSRKGLSDQLPSFSDYHVQL